MEHFYVKSLVNNPILGYIPFTIEDAGFRVLE